MTGRGARGLSAEGLRLKDQGHRDRHRREPPDPADGLDVLHKVGAGWISPGLPEYSWGGAYALFPCSWTVLFPLRLRWWRPAYVRR